MTLHARIRCARTHYEPDWLEEEDGEEDVSRNPTTGDRNEGLPPDLQRFEIRQKNCDRGGHKSERNRRDLR